MGRQTGLIKISGNIGGLSFYRSNGEDLARVANGPSKDKIHNDSNFARTRENNSEFGGSATAAKSLRLAFGGSVQTMGDNKLVSRLTAFFRELCNKGFGLRGQRSIELSANKSALEGLEFNNKVSFGSVFNAAYTITPDISRFQVTVISVAFMPQTAIKAPAGATHFRVGMTLGVVSDYVFNIATGLYEPTDAALDKLSWSDAGVIRTLNATVPDSIQLDCTIASAPIMTNTVSAVLALGIEFYQQVGGINYHLAQGSCMKIIKVF